MHYSSSLLLNRTVAGARRTTHFLAAALTPLSLALALGGCATSPPVEGPSLQAGRPIDRGALAAALNDDQPQAGHARRKRSKDGILDAVVGRAFSTVDCRDGEFVRQYALKLGIAQYQHFGLREVSEVKPRPGLAVGIDGTKQQARNARHRGAGPDHGQGLNPSPGGWPLVLPRGIRTGNR